MKFSNDTSFETLFTTGWGKDGRERVVVVTKASYLLPEGPTPDKSRIDLAARTRPLIEADEFEGDPGSSSPLLETDFSHQKKQCDVLFCGSAHGQGQAVVTVGLRVESWHKRFHVIGPRHWQQSALGGVTVSEPLPFDRIPISYGCAYGGTEAKPNKPKFSTSYRSNPVGVGYHPHVSNVDGLPLPNTQHAAEQVTSPKGRYHPMAFSPIGRNWEPRCKFVGTYDEAWLKTRVPFFPEDFDELYFQGAPPDQQIPFPKGGEQVVLTGVTSTERIRFDLPTLEVPVSFIPRNGTTTVTNSVVDTILFEPEHGVVSLTARAVYPTKRDIFELQEIIVSDNYRTAQARRRARESGKTYYPNLAQAVAAQAKFRNPHGR